MCVGDRVVFGQCVCVWVGVGVMSRTSSETHSCFSSKQEAHAGQRKREHVRTLITVRAKRGPQVIMCFSMPTDRPGSRALHRQPDTVNTVHLLF